MCEILNIFVITQPHYRTLIRVQDIEDESRDIDRGQRDASRVRGACPPSHDDLNLIPQNPHDGRRSPGFERFPLIST